MFNDRPLFNKGRILLVVSAFKPAMLADMQRARMLAWELPKLGWEVEVLTPRASEVRQDVIERDSEPFFPTYVKVHQVGSSARSLFELLGSHTHSWRTAWPIYQEGRRLLKSGTFNLVYFSTTTWLYFALGPRWRSAYDVRYILDYHDPWIKDTATPACTRRTWKSSASEKLIGRLERSAVTHATGIVAVSPKYLTMLRGRYREQMEWLRDGRTAVIPFGALEGDFDEVRPKTIPDDNTQSGPLRIVYVGVGGPLMVRSFKLICSALAEVRAQRNPLLDSVSIELFGTTYGWRPGDDKSLQRVANEAGVGDLVNERPERESYRRSLELLCNSRGALVLGVDDEGYMPSKLFSYALSGKPLLASLHSESPAHKLLAENSKLGHLLWFNRNGEMSVADSAREVAAFLEEVKLGKKFDRLSALAPFLAPAMARRHDELFDACLTN